MRFQMFEFASRLSDIIDKIIDIRVNGTKISEEKLSEYKNVINILEEAKINAENNKYFDIYDVIEVFPSVEDFRDDLFKELLSIQSDSIEEFDRVVINYLKKEEKMDEKDIRRQIMDNLCRNNDLYVEMINIILNEGRIDKNVDLIEVSGFDIKDLYELNNLSLFESYLQLSHMRNTFPI